MKRLLCVIASVWLLAGCPSTAPVTPRTGGYRNTAAGYHAAATAAAAAGYGAGSAENEKSSGNRVLHHWLIRWFTATA